MEEYIASGELPLHEDRLSPRELEIARAYAAGDNYHRIAERLFIAPSTVRTHLATIYRKLEVSSKLELHRLLEGESPQPKDQTDQAAIISELALSLEEAISRERALSEVLRIISGSEGKIEEVIASLLATHSSCVMRNSACFWNTSRKADSVPRTPKAFHRPFTNGGSSGAITRQTRKPQLAA